MIGHAGAAGDAVDQAFGLFQHAFEDALGIRQLPQHIHVDATQFSCAQAPLLRPSLPLMPLPPSTSGRTSLPEMRMGFKLFKLINLS